MVGEGDVTNPAFLIADEIAQGAQHRFLGERPLPFLDAVVETDMAPPSAIDPDRKRNERLYLLILEVLFEVSGQLPCMGLDHLATAAARAPFLPHRIVFEDALRVLRCNAELLPNQLQLESARRRAKPRVKILKAFLEATATESNGIEF